jgi:hypothetical protein
MTGNPVDGPNVSYISGDTVQAFFDNLQGVTPTGPAGHAQGTIALTGILLFANRHFYYKTGPASRAEPNLCQWRVSAR